MEENAARDFLAKTGLKSKEIAERLKIGDRTIYKYMNGSPIPPYVCKLIELEFSEYDLETGEIVLNEPHSKYATATGILKEKEAEIFRLKEKIGELNEIKRLQADNIELLKMEISRLKGNDKTAANS